MSAVNPTLSSDQLAESYSEIYAALAALRESFHRSGRLDDSNAKLDEVAKLFATCLAHKRGLIPDFPAAGDIEIIKKLQMSFWLVSQLPQYRTESGSSIFGENPKLILKIGDEKLASDLVSLVSRCIDLAFTLKEEGRSFDVLNEAFGHFVRDNFRGNVEDAQYMTPPEVTDFMVDILLHDIKNEGHLDEKSWVAADPSCGVGSFLTAMYHRSKRSGVLPSEKLHLIGQDKVERMVRLATINMELFNTEEHRILIGNSLSKHKHLDRLNGKVDFILTNPPFGARFTAAEVQKEFGNNTPFFSSTKRSTNSIDSELLFIDRNLKLLKDGGRLIIVVPDGVVSAKGTSAMLRQYLSGVATLRAVIELPSTAFAQAGTRTKTSILYLQKGRANPGQRVFMSKVTDLGFQVSTRKGVQVKKTKGENQLHEVLMAYKKFSESKSSDKEEVIISKHPSCVSVPEEKVLNSSWTASHYSAERIEAVGAIKQSDVKMVPLEELVDFCGENRRNTRWKPGMAFLSVLHVIGEGVVDILAAKNYSPKTPGIPTRPGEILFSRINPRIPRACITPDFGIPTLCSSEFEVMTTKDGVDPYVLMYLLMSKVVQDQIKSLTSGTSASHNRIRSQELASVLIPLPKNGSSLAKKIKALGDKYREAYGMLATASAEIALLRDGEFEIFSNESSLHQ